MNSKEIYSFNKAILQDNWNLLMKPKISYKSYQKPIALEEFENVLKKIEDFYNLNAIQGPEKITAREDYFQIIDVETMKTNIKNLKEKFETEENLKKKLAEDFEKTRISNKEEKFKLEEQINVLGKDLKEMQLELKKKLDLANEQANENDKLKNREKELEELLLKKINENVKSTVIEQKPSKFCSLL